MMCYQNNNLRVLLSVFVLLILQTATIMAMTNYAGTYKITQLVDATSGEVPLPNTIQQNRFKVQIQPNGSEENSYSLSMVIGNSMGGYLTVVSGSGENDSVTIGPIRSTKMMPSEDVYRVEAAVINIVPATNSISLSSDGLLVLDGPKGSLSCVRE
jgi:hypothetical protein